MSDLIGDLSQPVSFEAQSSTPDGYGGRTLTWTQVGARSFANIKPVRGGEAERGGALRSIRTYLVKVQEREDIDESMRIVWGAEIMNIREIRRTPQNVFPDGLFMVILAEAGVTQ